MHTRVYAGIFYQNFSRCSSDLVQLPFQFAPWTCRICYSWPQSAIQFGRDMDPNFAKLVETLAPKLDELLAMRPVRHGGVPMTLPMKGVYLFSKGRKHLYVGRSNALRKRFHRHF